MLRRQFDLLPHLPRLRRLATALCRDRDAADDLVHDAVARALDKQALFDGTNARAWLATILLNLFRSDRRRYGRLPVLVDLDSTAARSAGASEIEESGPDIKRALAALPEEQRIAMLLLALEGLSYREIASAQGVPIGTVMSRIARARENLRATLSVDTARIRSLKT